jgi:hypothetical protein
MVQVAEHIHAIIQKGQCRFSSGPETSRTRIRETSLRHLQNSAALPNQKPEFEKQVSIIFRILQPLTKFHVRT